MIIIQNKCDLLGSELEYNKGIEELKEFTERNGIKNCFRTSAMTGFGIQESMEYLIQEIIKVTEFRENEYDNENRETVAISDKPRTIRGKKNGCC